MSQSSSFDDCEINQSFVSAKRDRSYVECEHDDDCEHVRYDDDDDEMKQRDTKKSSTTSLPNYIPSLFPIIEVTETPDIEMISHSGTKAGACIAASFGSVKSYYSKAEQLDRFFGLNNLFSLNPTAHQDQMKRMAACAETNPNPETRKIAIAALESHRAHVLTH
jgi:hypothetical protein